MSTLYVVATPIGNLADASSRALCTLGEVGLIAAEDTRVTGNLLRHFGIRTRMVSLHRHNEAAKGPRLLDQMAEDGIDIALVTDAGTPGISDPGYLFVQEAWARGIEIVPIPGPTAMAAALSICGFDTRTFAFHGFLPRERGDLRRALLRIAGQGAPVIVLHESPHRIVDLMEAVEETLPGCAACVCCDLTKLHEVVLRGEARAVLDRLRENPKVAKGEYCVVLDMHAVRLPSADTMDRDVPLEARLLTLMLAGKSLRDSIEALQAQGIRKNEAKRAAITVQQFLDEQSPG